MERIPTARLRTISGTLQRAARDCHLSGDALCLQLRYGRIPRP